MKTLDTKKLFLLSFTIVILSNLIIFWNVYSNRHSEPTSLLTLTQRELPIHKHARDIKGRYLSIKWRLYDKDQTLSHRSSWLNYNTNQSSNWLSKTKLQELGFDMDMDHEELALLDDYEVYKETFVVLEFDAQEYQKSLAQEQKRYDQKVAEYNNSGYTNFSKYIRYPISQLNYAKYQSSRLFIVDAGHDFNKLRNKYPKNKYMITKGVIKVIKMWQSNKTYTLSGYISELHIPKIHLSKNNLAKINAIIKKAPKDKKYKNYPKYSVTLALGSKLEPYIVDIKAIEY
jgi:hypothetical protein